MAIDQRRRLVYRMREFRQYVRVPTRGWMAESAAEQHQDARCAVTPLNELVLIEGSINGRCLGPPVAVFVLQAKQPGNCRPYVGARIGRKEVRWTLEKHMENAGCGVE